MSRIRVGGRAEAVAHVGKAQEFLDAAEMAADVGWHNAAAANAVTAGINAKDAICLLLAGRTTAADDHRAAVAELRALGRAAGDAAIALDRLLGVKDRAQYDRRDVSEADAKAALRRARTLVETAVRLLHPVHPVPGG